MWKTVVITLFMTPCSQKNILGYLVMLKGINWGDLKLGKWLKPHLIKWAWEYLLHWKHARVETLGGGSRALVTVRLLSSNPQTNSSCLGIKHCQMVALTSTFREKAVTWVQAHENTQNNLLTPQNLEFIADFSNTLKFSAYHLICI